LTHVSYICHRKYYLWYKTWAFSKDYQTCSLGIKKTISSSDPLIMIFVLIFIAYWKTFYMLQGLEMYHLILSQDSSIPTKTHIDISPHISNLHIIWYWFHSEYPIHTVLKYIYLVILFLEGVWKINMLNIFKCALNLHPCLEQFISSKYPIPYQYFIPKCVFENDSFLLFDDFIFSYHKYYMEKKDNISLLRYQNGTLVISIMKILFGWSLLS